MGRPRTRTAPTCERCGKLGPLNATRYCSTECFKAARLTPPDVRFWLKVNKQGPAHPVLGTRCWIFTGADDGHGYGAFSLPGSIASKAHRVAWALARGPIPDGSNVLHRCDVRRCVNVEDHLFLGTLADNNRDMQDKGRASGPALLTVADVRVIRATYAAGATQRDLAQQFSVGQTTIQGVVTRRTWKHVT